MGAIGLRITWSFWPKLGRKLRVSAVEDTDRSSSESLLTKFLFKIYSITWHKKRGPKFGKGYYFGDEWMPEQLDQVPGIHVRVWFPSGTCLGKWRKNKAKKNAQHLLKKRDTGTHTRIYLKYNYNCPGSKFYTSYKGVFAAAGWRPPHARNYRGCIIGKSRPKMRQEYWLPRGT